MSLPQLVALFGQQRGRPAESALPTVSTPPADQLAMLNRLRERAGKEPYPEPAKEDGR